MKPATLVTPTGPVVTDTVSSPSFRMSGRMPATIARVVAHPSATNFEGSGPCRGECQFPDHPTQKSRITGDEDTP